MSDRMGFWTHTQPLHDLDHMVEARAISFENPQGARSGSARSASPLGVGRKGSPARFIAPGETLQLADIEGPGVIRHIWFTTLGAPAALRSLVIRGYWEGQEHPSIEAPVCDFFGFAHGCTPPFQTAVHSVSERYGMNIWVPMPFTRRARFTLTNEYSSQLPIFYQIDYTVAEQPSEGVGRLHVRFGRSNPTKPGSDFEILPHRRGRGRFLGCVLGVRPLAPEWWGEGEAKFYIDGDDAFPTVCSTGAEDYAGIAFCLTPDVFQFHGANYREKPDRKDSGSISMYRWHIPDPIFWKSDIRIAIQQIGLADGPLPATIEDYKARFVERADDWSCAAFWYEAVPSAPLPAMPGLQERTGDLPAWIMPSD